VIALEAARLMHERAESEYFTAKRKAAKRLCRQTVKPADLPSNAEIRDQIQVFARIHEGEKRTEHLRDMWLEALRLMRLLRAFRPRLIGSVMTGHVRKGSDIDLHVFSDSAELVTSVLENEGYPYDVERKHITKFQEARVFTHIHVHDRFKFELTVYDEDKAHYVFRMERVQQSARYHPEGDALYHTLQVFELAKEHRPYDEEFLLAALLHDVGKGLERANHVGAALSALDGLITEGTRFFIENHMHAHEYRAGTLGERLRRKLKASPDFDDLLLFSELDQAGRTPGAVVGTVDEALNFLKELQRSNS
jgi:predicted HD phosphohydrolase